MNNLKMYKVVISDYFKRHAKVLIKKNRSLKDHLRAVLFQFHKGNAIYIGKEVYKMRMQGQNKGKSGGYRLYIYVMEIDKRLSPIAIYSKNQKDNLSFEEMIYHLEKVKEEILG